MEERGGDLEERRRDTEKLIVGGRGGKSSAFTHPYF
jgi:hypothetical protein